MTVSIKKQNSAVSTWSVTLCFMLAAAAIMLPDLASAAATTTASDNPISEVICNVVTVLQGNVARGVAAFGVIFLGFSLFLGKISWGTALALGIGLGAIFGAQQIVNIIGGGTQGGMSCNGVASVQIGS